MNPLQLDLTKAFGPDAEQRLQAIRPEAERSLHTLYDATGAGNDFLGWLHLPSSITDAQLTDIEQTAKKLSTCQAIVIIGIGGSYLGARAVIEALTDSFDPLRTENRTHPIILYAGNQIGEDYLSELCDLLRGRDFGIINISKSGTTTEPGIAFRILRSLLEENVGAKAAKERIVAITDRARGALRTLADREGYKTYVIPDDVGGRYSVLTPVGLLPIAVAGIDIRALVRGAVEMERAVGPDVPFDRNPALRYAAARQTLYREGKKIEILANFHPKLHYVGEWWKQLYGESEGKDHRGIFPAAVDLTTDLHSMGQWIQQGERTIFETVISIDAPERTLTVPSDADNLDGLNYLAGRRVDEINKMAELGTRLAHASGGVPNLRVSIPRLTADCLGGLLYFFEAACGISGYLSGVNPFNQPGVEAYKRNMFALLDKPGFEAESRAIRAQLG
ncbi:glucose-6-phosphate isomerase [Tannerella sp. oral taxon 808]|nr:glucose-6-phosphate isomerase [Tannerella sp. oral taxon 808]